MTWFVLVLTGVGLVFAVLAWLPRSGSRLQGTLIVLALVALAGLSGITVFEADPLALPGEVASGLLLLVAGGLAVAGGGPLTTTVLALVDRNNPARQSTQQAGEVLRGGALIGALERGAIFASLVAGWPEGLAVVLAIKGLARYPELKAPDQTGNVTPHAIAERFIIGTFTSVLWSVTCASLLLA